MSTVSQERYRVMEKSATGDQTAVEVKNRESTKPNLDGDRLNFYLLVSLYTIQGFPVGLSSALSMILQGRGMVTYRDQVSCGRRVCVCVYVLREIRTFANTCAESSAKHVRKKIMFLYAHTMYTHHYGSSVQLGCDDPITRVECIKLFSSGVVEV